MSPGLLALAEGALGGDDGEPFDTIAEDELHVTDTVDALVYTRMLERLAMSDTPSPTVEFLVSLLDEAEVDDAVSFAWSVVLSETLEFSEELDAVKKLIVPLADAMMAIDDAASFVTTYAAIAEALTFVDLVRRGVDADVLDSAEAADAVAALTRFNTALVEELVAIDAAVPSIRFTVVVPESIEVSDFVSAQQTFLVALRDGLVAFAHVNLGDDEYTCWVMNTASRSVVEYQNFPFDAFASAFGTWYGASEFGVYELVGDDDDGTPIDAWVRTALSNLGTGKMKLLPKMYLGYTSSGNAVLKVVHTSGTGEKVEDWYTLRAKTAESEREGQINIGKGLKSVYFAWELHNVDGAEISIDEAALYPIVVTRRV